MQLLLDTHALIWWNDDSERLPRTWRAAIANPSHRVFVSAATAWELATKRRLGRLAFEGSVHECVSGNDFEW